MVKALTVTDLDRALVIEKALPMNPASKVYPEWPRDEVRVFSQGAERRRREEEAPVVILNKDWRKPSA